MGFFSQDCSKKCPANCLYGKCDFKLGNCTSGCAGPYFGQLCDQSACPHQAQYDAAIAFSIVVGILFALSSAGWAAHVYRTKKQGGYHQIKTNDIN
ncbi:hypothetical protein MP228_002988 [Amoeboaphelidium protococcarum]|nr:hypothetical protein MP228_002988 [Amoeboaphelidium protococcarum]